MLMVKERVVEYMKKDTAEEEKTPSNEVSLQDQLENMTLTEQRLSRKRLRCQVSPERFEEVPAPLIRSAKNCIDFIESKAPIDRTEVTNNFATNIVSLNDNAVDQLAER